VISISRTDVKPCVKGCGFLPPTAQYLDPYSKRPKAAALLAGLTWIQELLQQFPNHTGTNPLPLTIPVDNDGIVKEVHRTINAQTPTYELLSPDFDILQAIRTKLNELPIPTDIAHVKGHQDRESSRGMNSTLEQISLCSLTDKLTPSTRNPRGGLDCSHPGSLVLARAAALFHGEQQVTKGIPAYIRDAAHTPVMKDNLTIRRSNEATGRDNSRDNTTYEPIDWRHYGESFKKLSHGRRIQISKYTNNLLPTKRRLSTFEHRVDGCCFACNQLWEDTTHMLECTCDARCTARRAARVAFQQKLTCMHTPDILTHLLCNSMDSWLARRPVVMLARTGPA
jgi:hypothetical protein